MLPIIFMDLIDENDLPAFENLYESTKNLAYSKAYTILQNHSLAEECVSETFLAIAKNFQNVNKLDSDEQIKYIVISIRNRALNVLNKEKNVQTNIEYDDSTLIKDVSTELNIIELKELVSKLNQTDLDILYSVSIQGISYKEIASSYGISYAAAKQRYWTAKNNLLKLLSQEGDN